ncbi:MAG: serine/threonine protein kinase [Candidatus Sericytochromatia bacterium]
MAEHGKIFRIFDQQDSDCIGYGLETGQLRYFVKAARVSKAVAGLERAIEMAAALTHPAMPRLLNVVRTPAGPALVYEWAAGVHLYRGSPEKGQERFLTLPEAEILAALETIYDLHLQLAGRGWVMVDFYDGCLIYDFARHKLWIFDLDDYRPGPFLLESERLPGSSRFMAPEESQRGSLIDQVSNVYTLGQCARVLLGDGTGTATLWRGSASQLAVIERATNPDRALRFTDVAEFVNAWHEA